MLRSAHTHWKLILPVLALAACEPDALTTVSGDFDDPGVTLDAGSNRPNPPPVTPPNPPPPLPPPAIMDAGTPTHPDATTPDLGTPPPPPPPPVPDAGEPSDPDAGEPPPVQECYTEPFDPTVSITDLENDFGTRSAFDLVLEALGRRYPACHDLLVAEQNDPYTGSFTDGSSFQNALESAMTECHEATHGWDYRHALFYQYFGYWLRADLTPQLTFNVDGFPRSEIYGMIQGSSTNLYDDLYLTGDQGTRGLLELLDETNCYINGLGGMTAFGDYPPLGISARDGAVAFLYYVELYIKRARTQDPSLYQTMQNDTALKDLIKTQWLRTHFFLSYADMVPQLGINDGDIRQLLYSPTNMSEISMLIGRCVDNSNCLCD